MSNFNFNARKQLREENCTPTPSVPGGAYPSCNITSPYQTPMNTVGIGNPVWGGGDRFQPLNFGKKIKKKKSK